MWVNFLFPLLCMFLLCKSVTFHGPKSWDWNCISNSCATSCHSGPNVISLKPSLWNVTLVRENNGKETFLFPELWSFWPAAWIESSGCRLRIMGKHSLYIHNLWGSAENQKYCDLRLPAMVPPRALIHGIGQKDENKKKSRKNWYDSGRKNYWFLQKY